MSAPELAEILGASDRRVSQLVGEGITVRVGAGRYDALASVKAYIEFLRKDEWEGSDDIKKIELETAKESLMHNRLKTRKTELTVLQMENKLHPADQVKSIWGAIAVAVKSRLLSMPVKLAPQLLGIDDSAEIQAMISREVHDALGEIADYDPALFESEYEPESDEEDENIEGV